MSVEELKPLTPEQIAKFNKEREKTTASLKKDGAEEVLVVQDDQIEDAKLEMNTEKETKNLLSDIDFRSLSSSREISIAICVRSHQREIPT